MKQMTFADAGYAGKRMQTRKELFLIEMDQVVPWKGLIALIEPHYPKGEGGRPAYPLMAMLRIHLMQNWFGYSDPAMEESLYETTILRQFAGLHAHSTPSGHPVHQHPATRSTLIRPGSRSAATQVCIVSLKSLSSSISLRVCASIRPSVRSDKRCAPAGRGSRRPRSDRRSVHAICPRASGW